MSGRASVCAGRFSWRVFGRSVVGAAHVRAGKPCQDRIGWRLDDTRCTSLSVADGHGSPIAFRSGEGAELAVAAALDSVAEFAASHSEADLQAFRQAAIDWLPRTLAVRWAKAVRNALTQHPFEDAEWAALQAEEGRAAREEIERNPLIAYGTTILAVVATADHILYLQLGDGDIISIAGDGRAVRPIPRDPRLLGNATTSLCAPEAWQDCYVECQALGDAPPVLVMLSSDGYSNSFEAEGFNSVATDYLNAIRFEGPEAVDRLLPGWLQQTSEGGSGDDITVGFMLRCDGSEALPQPSEAPKEAE